MRDALLVVASTPMLTLRALGNARPVVRRVKHKVVRTSTGESGSLHVVGCDQAKMGTAAVGKRSLTGVVILVLPQWMVDVFYILMSW